MGKGYGNHYLNFKFKLLNILCDISNLYVFGIYYCLLVYYIVKKIRNPDARNTSTMQDLVRRISAMEYRLTARGLKPAPAVKEYCVKYYDRCYPKGEWYITDEKAL